MPRYTKRQWLGVESIDDSYNAVLSPSDTDTIFDQKHFAIVPRFDSAYSSSARFVKSRKRTKIPVEWWNTALLYRYRVSEDTLKTFV